MALTVGRIPSYYREVYAQLSGTEGGRISRRTWQTLADTASLPSSVLDQVWRSCNRGQESLGQDGLFKSLALIAVAQQGKPVEDWALDAYADKDLPMPKLAPLKETVKKEIVKSTDAISPSTFPYTYHDLQRLDTITVQLVPEKKGMVFKYQEYFVESKVLHVRVVRRFRDFAAFHECLICRYPFRLVPRLPPKKIAASPQFIEQRRKALRRFLLLIRRHPVLRDDEIVRYFFSFTGAEVAQHIKERYKVIADESMTSELARTARSHVTKEMVTRVDKSKPQISMMLQIVERLLGIAHRVEDRSEALSRDMKLCEKELSSLGNLDSTGALSIWSIGGAELLTHVKKSTRDISPKFSDIAEKATELNKKEIIVTEKLAYFCDMLLAYQDLCERREKSHSKHQKALTKMQTAVKEKDRIANQGQRLSPEETDRIERRDDELVRAENRNFFSIFCLNLEAQLVQANLQLLLDVLHDMVNAQVFGHEQLHDTWKELVPHVEKSSVSLITSEDSPILPTKHSAATSPKTQDSFGGDYSPW